MEEKNQETPLMSEFCEAIMERTADLIELKSERDCALLLCSDGDTLACRLEGSAHQVSSIISKKMLEDPVFAYCVGLAVNIYIVQKSGLEL